MMKLSSIGVMSFLVLLLAAGCGSNNGPAGNPPGPTSPNGGHNTSQPGPGAAAAAPTFTQVRDTILVPKCLRCHNDSHSAGKVNVTSYEKLMVSPAEQDNHELMLTKKQVIVPGNPAASKLYKEIEKGKMPKDEPRLSDAELKEVHDWIAAGAKND